MAKIYSQEAVAGVRRSVWTSTVTSSVVVALLAVVLVASTFLLLRLPDDELSKFSDVGQSFGVLSTLFSAGALLGVVVSVILQSRQNRRNDYESWQSMQMALLSRIIDEPAVFAPCLGDAGRFASEEEIRRFYFTTLYLNFGHVGLRTQSLTENDIRKEMCGEMFESPIARDLWVKRRQILAGTYGGLSPFYQIIDDEFERTEVVPNDPEAVESVT